MLKKLILLSAALLLAPLAFASGDVQMAPSSMFDGFYVGAGVNYLSLYSKTNFSVTSTEFHEFPPYPVHASMSVNSYPGNPEMGLSLFGGYGQTFSDRFYIGGELSGRYVPINGGHDMTLNINDGSGNDVIKLGELKSEASFAGALKFGFVPVHNVMLYALAGANYTYFEQEKMRAIGAVSGKNFNSWEYGFMPGLGVSYAFNNNWIVDLRSTWELFSPSFSHTDTFGKDDIGNPIQPKTKVTPYMHSVMLSIAYRIPYKMFN